MINYRLANAADAPAIAALHASSWKANYRGHWPDAYLDNEVDEERLNSWLKRMQNPEPNQWVQLAEMGRQLVGFACAFLDYDPQHGAFLDNIHVRSDMQGKRIGQQLLQQTARWVQEQRPESGLFLYVLKQNEGAIRFYERLGGVVESGFLYEYPKGVFSENLQVSWRDLSGFLQ